MSEPLPTKHILIAVSGNTPQIVTETLFALRVKENIPISEVFLVTTKKGKETALKTLAEEKGAIARFCREYKLAAGSIAFTPQHIITIKAEKTELEDIRTSDDNKLFGRQLLRFIEKKTSDPSTALYCSIAGGRKTMSAYMMLAMTLFGRPQDRLTHVLVNEDFESCEDFFFPPQDSQVIALPKGPRRAILRETKDSGIELGHIPFVKLRTILSKHSFRELRKGVEELVEAAQLDIAPPPPAPPSLRLDLSKNIASYGGEQLVTLADKRSQSKKPMEAAKLVLLAYFADRKKNYCVRPTQSSCDACKDCFQHYGTMDQTRFFDLIRAQYAESRKGSAEERIDKIGDYFDYPYKGIQSDRSKTNADLALTSNELKIVSVKIAGEARYGLSLDKNSVELIGVAPPRKKPAV